MARGGAEGVSRVKNGGRMGRDQMSLGRSREERGLTGCCQRHTVAPWILENTAHQHWLLRAALPLPDLV